MLRYRRGDRSRVHRPADDRRAPPARSRRPSRPRRRTASRSVYFIEARRTNGSVLVRRGHRRRSDRRRAGRGRPSADRRDGDATRTPSRPRRRRQAVLLRAPRRHRGRDGRAATGEATLQQRHLVGRRLDARPASWRRRSATFVTPQLMLGVQARLQLVTRRDAVSRPDPDDRRVRHDEHVCSPSTGAFAGLLKATWFLAEPEQRVSAVPVAVGGGGTIRHVSKVSAPPMRAARGQPSLHGHRRGRTRAVRARASAFATASRTASAWSPRSAGWSACRTSPPTPT